MKLKLYQSFHDEEAYKQCSGDSRVIKLCLGYEIGGHIGLKGDFVVANEGKYIYEIIASYTRLYYVYHHITDEDYIGVTQSAHNARQKTDLPIGDIFKIDLDKIFKGYHIIVFHPWNNIIDHTNRSCPGMIDFILKWMREDLKIREKDIEEIVECGRKIPTFFRENFIMPVGDYKEFFSFETRFIEWVDRNYNIKEYKLNIRVPRKNIAWCYFLERIPNFYLLNKYRRKLKILRILLKMHIFVNFRITTK